MWTSRPGDGYISLTTHYMTAEFDLMHHNLTTYPLPGTHDHTNIAYALRKLADEWVIDLESQVSCFTTDNGSNIVKTIKMIYRRCTFLVLATLSTCLLKQH